MKHRIYAIPGLGADRRMFAYQLQLDYDIQFIEWITPLKKESLGQYAARFSKLFDTSQPFSLLGVSLGGMMCMELAKHLPAEKVILVSSCKTKNELPPQLRLMKTLKLHKLVSASVLKRMIKFYSNTFGDLDGELKTLFNHMIANCDPTFLIWAADAVINWDNEDIMENVVHIHGTKDKVLQFSFVENDITVEGGTHYMIGTRVEEVNELISNSLA